MWKKVVTVIASIMLIVGIGLFMFPIVSNFVGTQISKSETEKFDTRVENVVDEDITYEEALEEGKVDEEGYLLDEKGERKSETPVVFKLDLDRLLKDSKEYNENLKENQGSLLVSDYAYSQPSINLGDYGISDGIYGYVSAETIGMRLPIYLGANSSTMSYGAAHLTYTSLPIGGENTNTVIAGHTGYVGRIFFDNLRNLKIGDEVTLRNYWEDLSYKVVETKIVQPNQSGDIFIKSDRDLLTMITCIRTSTGEYGRYFVICERV
ncbi:MAG: class C sortase [Ruminococcus sp.]|nr:class C sortase [Ruminococcus sp.]